MTATANLTVNVTPGNTAVIALNPFAVLSPPNYSLHTFAVSQMVKSATDDCGGNVISSVSIEKAASDEVVYIVGGVSTTQDIVTGADCRASNLFLTAETATGILLFSTATEAVKTEKRSHQAVQSKHKTIRFSRRKS